MILELLARLDPGPLATRLALAVLAQVTVVIALAAAAAATAPALRRGAAARHALWVGTLAWVFLCPAVAAVAGRAGLAPGLLEIPWPRPVSQATVERAPAVPPPGAAEALDRAEAATSQRAPAPRPPRRGEPEPEPAPTIEPQRAGAAAVGHRREAIAGGLGLLWAAGVLWCLGRIAAGGLRLASLTPLVRPLDAARHGEALAQARDALGVAALPTIVTAPRGAVAGPAAVGLLRPRVVLPEGLAEALDVAALRDVLVHECAHVLRRDAWVGLLQRLAAALFWPHPPVHYLNAQLSRAREEVCDNHVLRRGDACGYARTLLALTEHFRPAGAVRPRPGLGLLGAGWTLADRVAGLLDPGRMTMTRTNLRAKFALTLTLTAAALGVASVRLGGPLRAEEAQAPAEGRDAANPGPPEGVVRNISGVVVDEEGRPVAGAVVHIPRFPALARGGMTAADGTFTIALSGLSAFSNGGLVVELDDGARAGLGRFTTPLISEWQHEPIRIVVKPTRPLTVRVRDAAGAPVAGAAVAAVEFFYQTASTTGPDGVAVLRVAADAAVGCVMGRKSGVGFDYFENAPSRPDTDAPPPPPPLPAEVGLQLDGADTIRVKAVDSEGRPLPGLVFTPGRVNRPGKESAAATNLTPIARATTDVQGIATFDWLPRGGFGYRFATGSTDYSMAEEPNYVRGGPTELTVRMLRATRLGGTVRFPDGRPAPGVLVRAQGSGTRLNPGRGMTRTGPDGAYALDVPPEESYVVAVEDDDWAAPSRAPVVLREGRPQGGLDFALVKGTLLRGRVTEGPDRKPSPRMVVSLIEEGPVLAKEYRRGDTVNAQFRRPALTDAQGNYRFRVVPGRYTMQMRNLEPFTFEVGDGPEAVRNVSLPGPARVAYVGGTVIEKTPTGERPVPGANVWGLKIGEYGRTGWVVTDDAGRFASVPRSANMLLYATAGGTLAGYTAVPEGADDVKVVVAPAARVTGRVVDTEGKPQVRVWVNVQMDFGSTVSQSAHFRGLSTLTNDEGRFSHGYPVGTEGEVAAFHRSGGRPTGARTVVTFRVSTAEPIELTDLIVPPAGPAK